MKPILYEILDTYDRELTGDQFDLFSEEFAETGDSMALEQSYEFENWGGWPRKNVLLPGLVKTNRKYKDYKAWARNSHEDVKKEFLTWTQRLGLNKKRFDDIASQLYDPDDSEPEKDWKKVEMVFVKFGKRGPPPGTKNPPTPGFYYQIKRDDTMIQIGRQAYSRRMKPDKGSTNWRRYLRGINCHPSNKRFLVPTIGNGNRQIFGNKMISFSNKWEGDLIRLNKTPFGMRPPAGDSYALIFIPTAYDVNRFACKH